jgi:hypothetical protein
MKRIPGAGGTAVSKEYRKTRFSFTSSGTDFKKKIPVTEVHFSGETAPASVRVRAITESVFLGADQS